MSAVEFGFLEDAPLREAWSHEAHNFTPWLAENLGRISACIGIPLELDGVEVPVGRFSADILARNPIDDTRVLIENQLEHGDHSHLGQILTYLTGLDARTVVWIAQDFREEHLSAIRWLNQHTEAAFSFIAVRLRVVRIGASPYAPLFEIVERPNGWDRQVQVAAKVAGGETRPASELGAQRRAFWDRYVARRPEAAKDPRVGGGVALWRTVPGTDLVISQWFSVQGVGLFVRGGRGAPEDLAFERLKDHLPRLEERLGAPAGRSRFAFNKVHDADMGDPANWDAAGDWLSQQTLNYLDVLGDAVASDESGASS